ncbi:MAG: hypothetical protein EBE86_006755 [Hormoscilla sp. GUM202]|nr:hypothetical protein [Hormoscilla sp. GUM202]
MRSGADIWEKYWQQGIVRGGELYRSLPQALNFVPDCQLNNLAIIGIDGFLYDRSFSGHRFIGDRMWPGHGGSYIFIFSDNWWIRCRCAPTGGDRMHPAIFAIGLIF